MKSINFKSVLLAFLMLMGVNMVAQDSQVFEETRDREVREKQHLNPEEKAKKVSEMMTKKLNLNEQQASKIYNMTLIEAQERKVNMDKMRAERAQKQAAHDKEMQSILTPEQYDQFKKMKSDRKGKRKMKRKRKHKKMSEKDGDID